jgi:hypothetical protein
MIKSAPLPKSLVDRTFELAKLQFIELKAEYPEMKEADLIHESIVDVLGIVKADEKQKKQLILLVTKRFEAGA